MIISAILLKFHPNWNIFANSSFKYAVVIVKKSPDTSNSKTLTESSTSKLNIDESTDLKMPEGAVDIDGIILGCTLCTMVGNCDGDDESAIEGNTDGDNDGASLCTKVKATSIANDKFSSRLSRNNDIYSFLDSGSANNASNTSSMVC